MRFRLLEIITALGTMSAPTVSAQAAEIESLPQSGEQNGIRPTATIKFADRDEGSLFFDFYAPVTGKSDKPTIIYIFGGGFRSGQRSQDRILSWFEEMQKRGYGIVAIDYRLGLKDMKYSMSPSFIKATDKAIGMAIEDLFSATSWIIGNGSSLGIDPDNLVLAGSSAGAITALQAEWEISQDRERAGVLPEGFNYRGVMAFSGAILSLDGLVRYRKGNPCPQLLFHGTADKIVVYKKTKFLSVCFSGSSCLAKELGKSGSNYRIYRIEGASHEIASCELHFLDTELDFLERNVIGGEVVRVDATISDPAIEVPDWARGDTASLYNE